MTRHVIAGTGPALDTACETAEALRLDYARIPLVAADGYHFDLGPLQGLASDGDALRLFIALDARAVNQARQALLSETRGFGIGAFNLVSPGANVSATARLMGNVHVGPGCTIGAGATLGIGAWLGRQVFVGDAVHLGACTTLMGANMLGDGTRVGAGSTLGQGALVSAGSTIGRRCEWLLPGQVPALLAPGTFVDALMPEGARILNA